MCGSPEGNIHNSGYKQHRLCRDLSGLFAEGKNVDCIDVLPAGHLCLLVGSTAGSSARDSVMLWSFSLG